MSDPSLVFASAVGGSAFMEELFEVVADAVRDVGGRARTHVGPLPDADEDTVYVIVPHEYLVVTPAHLRPRPDQLRRTIGFCVEHPGTRTFETSASLLGALGGVVDINEDSTAELTRRAQRVHRYVLGYTRRWDAWGGDLDQPRELDVTYLGTAERRRSKLLDHAVRALDRRSVRLLVPPHEPMTRPRPDFLMGRAKHEHLAHSRVLINLHRENSTALEWVRVLEAACNGCVVVTEPSSDMAPFVAGRQLIVARAAVLGQVTAALLDDPGLERQVRAEAYRFVREELDMASSARKLLEISADLAESSPAPAGRGPMPVTVAADRGEPPMAIDTPAFDPMTDPRRAEHDPAPAARIAAELAAARTETAQRLVPDFRPATVALAARTARRAPEVDVLIVRRSPEPAVGPLVDDLALGTVVPGRILVCADGGPASVSAHFDEMVNPDAAGMGWSRNQLLDRSTALLLLVLSADMRCAPGLLEALLDTDADIAHCPIGDEIDGFVGALPMEARRLAAIPYLGAGYLVRREVLDRLGRWSTDPWCDGLEDHLFWRAAAAAGHTTEFVQNALLSRTGGASGSRPIDLDPKRAWQAAN